MNARELLDLIDKHASPHSVRADGLDVKETILRALRLLAAAEANDGTGCELIENLRTEADLCRNETATDIADLLDDAASALIATGAQFNALKDERNGLAARVRELERLVEVARNDMDSMRKRHADEMARYGCPFVNSVVSREDGHFIAHQIIETYPTPNGLTVVIADAARGSKP